MLKAGKLRHKITIENPVSTQANDGSVSVSYQKYLACWASIEPLSVKEFIVANTTEHKINARITIRYNAGITSDMRVKHGNKIYNIEGIQPDLDSGIEYLTLACSTGILTETSQQT